MAPTIRPFVLATLLGLAAWTAAAQTQSQWTVGVTYGAVDDIEGTFSLHGFHPHDVTAWVDFKMESQLLLRLSYVNMNVNSDRSVAQPAPGLRTDIEAGTVGVSYTLFEGFYSGGLFGGIGGYLIEPQGAAPDPKQTAFGFHVGVDGDFRVAKPLSVVLRLTYYGILSETKRSLLSATAGVAVHF